MLSLAPLLGTGASVRVSVQAGARRCHSLILFRHVGHHLPCRYHSTLFLLDCSRKTGQATGIAARHSFAIQELCQQASNGRALLADRFDRFASSCCISRPHSRSFDIGWWCFEVCSSYSFPPRTKLTRFTEPGVPPV